MKNNIVQLEKFQKKTPYDSLKEIFNNDLDKVEDFTKLKLSSAVNLIDQMASYQLNSGGKRLRSILTLASSKITEYRGEHNIHLAACVELIHSATLLHDDVIDNSTVRRGKKTSNVIWGNQPSILVGDYFLSRCFEIMVDVGSLEILKLLSNVSAEIAQGEVLQLQHKNEVDMTEQVYLNIVTQKTASLFGAAMKVGGCLANKSENEKKALQSYGVNLGIVFQISDDILDYNSTKAFGKNIGNDFYEGKITLPIIILFQKSNEIEREQIKKYFAQKIRIEKELNQILLLIKKYDVITICKKRAEYFSNVSSDSLNIFKDSDIRKNLQELSFYLINRTN
ncbi:MAG: polyprenyl synthetase family protein [Proteobacteria bacterium]|jgi:octaprenyl-diphosphate synthase|nr:polyprenyl synthetase family protein [Candidatus Fonsibacter sp. PEL5]NKA16343.1 polyprenyl synthetase family protein [Candidatus Fonsibacter sp. PEL55]